MASRPSSPDLRPAAPRLYLVTPPVQDLAALAGRLADALDGGDVAAVLVRAPQTDDDSLINRVKALAAPTQNKGAALLIDGHPGLVAQSGADGTHVTGAKSLASATALLKPAHIVGVGGLTGRHDAMSAGEGGADYVMFGEPDEHGRRPAFEAIVERVAWWAELFVVPCVGYAASLDEIEPLCSARADFIAVEDLVFSDSRGPRAAFRDVTSRLHATEPAQ